MIDSVETNSCHKLYVYNIYKAIPPDFDGTDVQLHFLSVKTKIPQKAYTSSRISVTKTNNRSSRIWAVVFSGTLKYDRKLPAEHHQDVNREPEGIALNVYSFDTSRTNKEFFRRISIPYR